VFCKICCIKSVDEARLALAHGASALGLVSEMPSGPGTIPEEKIAEIVAALDPAVETFLLTSQHDPERIVAQQRRTGVSTLQLCDALPAGAHEQLRRELPGVSLVQVVHVRDPSSIEEAITLSPHCDSLLLDSGDTSLAVKELGGTGRVHDWSISRAIVEQAGVPVYLAGGLRPENVREAVERVGPHGVDLCTGVRTDGRLDAEKLRSFFDALPAD
jgi:phosphoribosylanthranilate isomerase